MPVADQSEGRAQQQRVPDRQAKGERAVIHVLGRSLRRFGLAHAVAHAAHGMDQLDRERIVDLAAQIAHVDIDDVGDALEALIPDVLEDHGAGEHAPG